MKRGTIEAPLYSVVLSVYDSHYGHVELPMHVAANV